MHTIEGSRRWKNVEQVEKKKENRTKSEAIEEPLKIDDLSGVGKRVKVVDGALGFLNKDVVSVLAEGLDGEDLARMLSLPLPMLLGNNVWIV